MLLSVLMPVYNENQTLEDIIQRVLSVQLPSEMTAIEIVAVDDGSTDGSREILKRISDTDPRVRLVLHE